MQEEIKALKQNHTWVLTNLPPGKQPIGSKWVYKLKLNTDGSVQCYKARVVAKGYNQLRGIDYHECFSPGSKVVTVRVFFFVTAIRSWAITQVDINNAFLHSFLNEEIYMTPPEGYLKVKQGQVCCLKRSLYGLK